MTEMAHGLLVNIGNTHTVFALESGKGSFQIWRYPTRDLAAMDLPACMTAGSPAPGNPIFIGGVVPHAEQILQDRLEKAGFEWVRLDPRLAVRDVQLSYEPLASLGFDRICKLLAGALLVPKGNSLLIDMGTAVTVDLLRAGTVHEGGLIMPGEAICLEALARYTAQLPSLPPAEGLSGEAGWGLDTRHCMRLGTQEMLAGALERIIGSAQAAYPDIEIIITGGAAPRFLPLVRIGGRVRHVAEMALLGMRRLAILQAARDR